MARDWVVCPICGESDMRLEDGMINCTNLNCGSNGGSNFQGAEAGVTVEVGGQKMTEAQYHAAQFPLKEKAMPQVDWPEVPTDYPIKPSTEPAQITLNREDEIERVVFDIVAMNRRKRRDYALDTDPLSNFMQTADAMGLEGFTPVEAAEFNVVQKEVRLRALRANGRMDDPANESVEDTLLDRAVYAVLVLALWRRRAAVLSELEATNRGG